MSPADYSTDQILDALAQALAAEDLHLAASLMSALAIKDPEMAEHVLHLVKIVAKQGFRR